MGVGDGQGSLGYCSPWDSLGKNAGMDCHALIPNPQTEPGASCIFCFTGGFFTAEPHGKPHDKLRQRIKNRDITLLTKVHTVKAMVFPVVMYGCWVHTCMDGKLGHKEG